MKTVADEHEDRGWYLHFREDDKQWELTYRVAPNKWKKHRVPRKYGTEPQAERYSAPYVAEKKRLTRRLVAVLGSLSLALRMSELLSFGELFI